MSKIPILNRNFFMTPMCDFYDIGSNNTSVITNALANTNLIDNFKDLFSNKSDYVVSFRGYPFAIQKFFNTYPASEIKIGNGTITLNCLEIQASGGTGDTTTGIRLIFDQIIAGKYLNFLDYEPYTKMQMHIPYIGFVNLPVNDIIGKRLRVYYGVDLNDGSATAWIVVGTGANEHLLMTITGKVGYDLPIGRTNASDIARNNLLTITKAVAGAVSLAGGVASGNGLLLAGGVGLVASTGVNAINGNTPHYSRGQTSGGFMNLNSPNSTFIIVEHTKPLINDLSPSSTEYSKYKHNNGIPLGESRTLSTLSGFTKVSQCHLIGFGNATSEELDMIESELKSGVLL